MCHEFVQGSAGWFLCSNVVTIGTASCYLTGGGSFPLSRCQTRQLLFSPKASTPREWGLLENSKLLPKVVCQWSRIHHGVCWQKVSGDIFLAFSSTSYQILYQVLFYQVQLLRVLSISDLLAIWLLFSHTFFVCVPSVFPGGQRTWEHLPCLACGHVRRK